MTTQKKLTQAEKFAAPWGNEGDCMQADSRGRYLACEIEKKPLDTIEDTDTGAVKYIFDDGSSIVIAGCYWDFGYSERYCTCFAGESHALTCEQHPDYVPTCKGCGDMIEYEEDEYCNFCLREDAAYEAYCDDMRDRMGD